MLNRWKQDFKFFIEMMIKKYSDFFFSSMIGPCFTCLLRERLKNCSCATSD